MATRADAIAKCASIFIPANFSPNSTAGSAYQTESQNPGRAIRLRAYLVEGLQPAFAELDFRRG